MNNVNRLGNARLSRAPVRKHRKRTRNRSLILASIACVVSMGCAKCLRVNPFQDELADMPRVTTPSVETARAADVQPTQNRRDWASFTLQAADGTVHHGPLYFEDPFEDKGSDDGKLAWTGEDYLQFFYWRGRYIVNLIAFPVSAVVTPPWTVMESDGYLSCQALGCDHDACPACCCAF